MNPDEALLFALQARIRELQAAEQILLGGINDAGSVEPVKRTWKYKVHRPKKAKGLASPRRPQNERHPNSIPTQALEWLNKNEGSYSAPEIAVAIGQGKKARQIGVELARLFKKGDIKRTGYGIYERK